MTVDPTDATAKPSVVEVDHTKMLADLGAQRAVEVITGVCQQAGMIPAPLIAAALDRINGDIARAKAEAAPRATLDALENVAASVRAVGTFRKVLVKLDERNAARAQILNGTGR